jgi:hypothetical protein
VIEAEFVLGAFETILDRPTKSFDFSPHSPDDARISCTNPSIGA